MLHCAQHKRAAQLQHHRKGTREGVLARNRAASKTAFGCASGASNPPGREALCFRPCVAIYWWQCAPTCMLCTTPMQGGAVTEVAAPAELAAREPPLSVRGVPVRMQRIEPAVNVQPDEPRNRFVMSNKHGASVGQSNCLRFLAKIAPSIRF